ncbi:probable dihydroxyacetone kinase regulator [Streptococcus criceti]|uniref:HTH tetR-type domain-containing protein n=1 Tax=Streptococcus criceti HS-6 TaxID=873449 RepID=G5JNZ1_STRCG|nr:TetR/AcrR family transcriptional regulator [Streptococcus criceti]EHI74872.1 hypothetical protein STRCR_1522 [Streptococcus criceti HS-6]SUN43401.1 probable dihydroxyacetone kinase regulator [Streptococcus criceti]
MSEQVNFLPDKLWLMLKKLLQDTDLDRVTVKNLCTEAKIHRATFYRYFSDILALLEYGLKKELSDSLNHIIDDKGSVSSFKSFFKSCYDLKEIALNIQETKYHSIIRDIKLDFVQAYIKQSFEEEDVLSHQILIHFYTTGFIGLVDLFFTNSSLDIDSFSADMSCIYQHIHDDFNTHLRHK